MIECVGISYVEGEYRSFATFPGENKYDLAPLVCSMSNVVIDVSSTVIGKLHII
jgi:hypothetical protein